MTTTHLDLGRIITPAKVRRAGNTHYPILSMTMRDGLVNQADKFKKRIASADTSPYKVVERNQLVVGFPIDEGVLAFQNLHDEAIVSPAYNIWNLQNDALVDTKYLERFLRSPRALSFYASKLRSTTARRRTLPNDIFLSLTVPVPPLPDQERIVKLLDEADDLRELRVQADRRTAALIPALFHEMFGDPATNKNNWDLVELVGVIAREKHSIMRGPFGGALKKEIFVPDGFKVYEQKNAIRDDFEIGSYFIDKAKFNELESFSIRPDDLIVSCSGTIGKVAIVPSVAKPGIINQALLKLRLDRNKALPVFVKHLLETDHMQTVIFGGSAGSAIKNVKPLSQVKKTSFALPPLPLQKEFADRVTEIREVQAEQAGSRRRLDDLFQSLLHRAFNGEL